MKEVYCPISPLQMLSRSAPSANTNCCCWYNIESSGKTCLFLSTIACWSSKPSANTNFIRIVLLFFRWYNVVFYFNRRFWVIRWLFILWSLLCWNIMQMRTCRETPFVLNCHEKQNVLKLTRFDQLVLVGVLNLLAIPDILDFLFDNVDIGLMKQLS